MALSLCPSSAAEEAINDNSSQNRRTSETPEPNGPVGNQPKKVALQQQKANPKPAPKPRRKEEEKKTVPPCHLVVMGESMSLTIGTSAEKEGKDDQGTAPNIRIPATMTQLRKSMVLTEELEVLMALPTHPEIKNWYPPRKWTLFEPSPPTSEDEEEAEMETVKQARGRKKKQKVPDKAASSRAQRKKGSQDTVGSTESESGRSLGENLCSAALQERDATRKKAVKKRAKHYVDQDLDAEDRLRCKVLHDQLGGSKEVKVMPPRIREDRLWKIKPRTPEAQGHDRKQTVAKEEAEEEEQQAEEGSSVSKQTDSVSETQQPQEGAESPVPSIGRVSYTAGRNSVVNQENEQERDEMPEAVGGGLTYRGESIQGEGEEEEKEEEMESGEEKAGSGEKDEGGIQRARSSDVGKMDESREAILADEGEKEDGEDVHDTEVEEQEM